MNPKEYVDFLSSHWHQKIGLVVSLIAALIITAPILASASATFNVWVAVMVGEIILIVISWLLGQRIPRVKKDKIGFVVAFNCSDIHESERVEEDFINPLKKLILSGQSGKTFHFIVLPQHFSQKIITIEDALKARVKMGAHFIIFGDVKNRTINGKPHHVLDLHGSVAHTSIPSDVAANFTREFSNYLPRKLQIPTDGDVIALQFTSEWAEIVARYIIANAAMFSGDLLYAEQLLIEVQEKLKNMSQHFHIYAELAKKVPLRLADLYEALIILHHRLWVEKFDDDNIKKIKAYIDKVPLEQANRRAIVVTTAICEFWLNRDVKKSIGLITSLLKNNEDEPILNYNIAFLHAYNGNLKSAIRHYRKASLKGVDNDELYQIEEFINKVLSKEPEKFQLHYCLGFFNKEAKGDYLIAQDYLSQFLKQCPSGKFSAELKLAQQWLDELSELQGG